MKKRVLVLQVDTYTKTVLTVIALCLIGMVIKPILNVRTAGAESKEAKEIKDVNIALINGQPLEIALPLRVSIAKSRTIGVKIEDSETLPVEIKKPERLSVRIDESDTIPVNMVSPKVLDTKVLDSVPVPVKILSPFPIPVVQTIKRGKTTAESE